MKQLFFSVEFFLFFWLTFVYFTNIFQFNYIFIYVCGYFFYLIFYQSRARVITDSDWTFQRSKRNWNGFCLVLALDCCVLCMTARHVVDANLHTNTWSVRDMMTRASTHNAILFFCLFLILLCSLIHHITCVFVAERYVII